MRRISAAEAAGAARAAERIRSLRLEAETLAVELEKAEAERIAADARGATLAAEVKELQVAAAVGRQRQSARAAEADILRPELEAALSAEQALQQELGEREATAARWQHRCAAAEKKAAAASKPSELQAEVAAELSQLRQRCAEQVWAEMTLLYSRAYNSSYNSLFE